MKMEKNFKVFGISGTIKDSLENTFETWSEGSDHYTGYSKQTYEHDEEGLHFKYKYVINASIYSENGEELVCYELALVPTPDSLPAKKFKSLIEFADIEPKEANACDVFEYGMAITFAEEVKKEDMIDDEVLDSIANVIDTFEGIFGFIMDKQQNSYGDTGWDVIKTFLGTKDFDEIEEIINNALGVKEAYEVN